MKKILLILIIGLLLFAVFPIITESKGGSSRTTVYFYKDDGSGPYGTMTYNVSGSTFNFSFTGMAPIDNDWYALVVGEDPYNHPETTVIIDYPRSLPNPFTVSKNIELNRDLRKVQVWLVHADDIITDGRYTKILSWTKWHPQEYLFGAELVHYNDRDPGIH